METWGQGFITILASILVTSGFWTFLTIYIQKRLDKKDVTREMLIGLGHDRIVWLGLCYLERGWVTQAEYENIKDYLFKPYSKMGGNGTAFKIIQEVDKLPIKPYNEFRNPPNCHIEEGMRDNNGQA